MNRLDELSVKLLGILDGKPLMSPRWNNCERIAAAVCNATGMTPEKWDQLKHGEDAEPWLEMTIKKLSQHSNEITGTPDVPLTGNDERVLRCLFKHHPSLRIKNDISGDADVSEETVRKSLDYLISKKLVVRPKGQRQGACLTGEGKALCDRMFLHPPNDT